MLDPNPFANVLEQLTAALPNLLIAILILVVGWLVATLLASVVRRVLERTGLDDRLAGQIGTDPTAGPARVERWISLGVFWLVMLFVLVAFFQRLQLTTVSGPLGDLLDAVTAFLPRLLGAALLLAVAWVIATVVRALVLRGARLSRLDERLADTASIGRGPTAPEPPSDPRPDRPGTGAVAQRWDAGAPVSVVEPLATAAFWLVFLVFLPAILGTLQLEGLVAPVQDRLGELLAVVPNIFAAGAILIVGWFAARVVRQIAVNLAQAAGLDRFGARAGVSGLSGLSTVIGTIAYALVLIPTVIAALDALHVQAISEPATRMLGGILDAVPNLFGAGLILAVAYLAGRLIADLVTSVLQGVGFDALPARLGLRTWPTSAPGARATGADPYAADPYAADTGAGPSDRIVPRSPSEVVGLVVLGALLLVAAIAAADLLNFAALSALLSQLLAFGAKALLAAVVFAVGLYLANLARDVLLSASGPQANLWAAVVRGALLVLISAMALQEMGIAEEIVNLAFGIILGAIGIAVALAFGLGGRRAAGRQVERWLETYDGPDRP